MESNLLTDNEGPTRVTLRHICLASLVKWQTFVFFVLGIFAGIIYTTSFAITGQISGVVIVWYFLLTPLMYALVGLISSVIVGLAYNVVASRTGGIQVDIVTQKNPVPPPPPERWEGTLPKIDERETVGRA
jgi:hypothetical protein